MSNMKYETKVVDVSVEEFYSLFAGETDWWLVDYTEYYYTTSAEGQEEPDSEEQMDGHKIRAIFQREFSTGGGVNWAGWVTGAVIATSIWATALYILT